MDQTCPQREKVGLQKLFSLTVTSYTMGGRKNEANGADGMMNGRPRFNSRAPVNCTEKPWGPRCPLCNKHRERFLKTRMTRDKKLAPHFFLASRLRLCGVTLIFHYTHLSRCALIYHSVYLEIQQTTMWLGGTLWR